MRRKIGSVIFCLMLCCAILTGCRSAEDVAESIMETLISQDEEAQPAEGQKETAQQPKDRQETAQQPEDRQETAQQPVLQKAELVRVVDGDTIIVKVDGEKKRVRLIGINTAESAIPEDMLAQVGKENTEEGKQASEFVKDLLEDVEEVWLQKDVSETDKYDRLLRYVWTEKPTDAWNVGEVGDKMLNGIIVKNGYSKAIAYKPDTAYHKIFEKISESR
ncbi:MAG: thermonuclease family protein [Lachnospiraceae bacterium]|nr:thermonuclease family protein [Lachnospiraceae bacterium]